MKKLDKTAEHFRKNEVSALIEISKMYTQKDLCEFAEWCNGNSWLYANYSKLWANIGGVQKTTSQLREDWEIETGRRVK
jgi:hypothetical protein